MEVVAGGGENGVDAVALGALEIVATHAVLGLEMADDGLDGGAAFHLAPDGDGDPADLAGDPDPELVGVTMAAIALGFDMDTVGLDAGELFQIGDDGAPGYGRPYGFPWSALAWRTNWPPLGKVTGVATLTLQPNS